LYAQLYERDTLARVWLRGRTLSRIRLEDDGSVAHTYVELKDLEELGALPSDTEELVNAALAITGVSVSVFFVEQPGNKVKISFRSRGTLDCNRLARQFNGGGHVAAAGATVSGSLADVRRAVLDAVRNAKQNHS
jgi:phosphoesterase RecJ-like protein